MLLPLLIGLLGLLVGCGMWSPPRAASFIFCAPVFSLLLRHFLSLPFQVLFSAFSVHVDLKRTGYEQHGFWFTHEILTLICISECESWF